MKRCILVLSLFVFDLPGLIGQSPYGENVNDENTVSDSGFGGDTISRVISSGRKPVSGDTISGVVIDNTGPIMMVNVTERDSMNKIVMHSSTDIDGRFSFKLVNPDDYMEVSIATHQVVKTDFTGCFFDVVLIENNTPLTDYDFAKEYYPPTGYSGRNINMRNQKAMSNHDYPLLFIDGMIVTRDSTEWQGLDPTKDSYNTDEIARLFGIEAGEIKSVKTLRENDAIKAWGNRGANGVIEVMTK